LQAGAGLLFKKQSESLFVFVTRKEQRGLPFRVDLFDRAMKKTSLSHSPTGVILTDFSDNDQG